MERTLDCGCLLVHPPLGIRYCPLHRATEQAVGLLRGLRHVGETGHRFGSVQSSGCQDCMDAALVLGVVGQVTA